MHDQLDNIESALICKTRKVFADASGARILRDTTSPTLELEGYDLIREIGRGGQGIVYQAIQRSTQRHVAIKVLRHGVLASAGEQARLEREVRILAQLRHPGIVTVHDSGCSGNLSYVVMDFIEGIPLDAWIAQTRPEARRLVLLFQQIAEAVNGAHVRGVIHRDLKPANIRIDSEGVPHVLDFGVAKLLESEAPLAALTTTGQFVGSLQWSAPEQVRGDPSAVDVRTDVYALGVIFWHAFTGAFPYTVDGDMSRILANILSADPTRPGGRGTRLPFDVETILRKCLSKDLARRYQSAGELADDLRCYLDGRPVAARRDSPMYVLRKTVERHRVVFGLAAALLVLAVSAAIGLGILYFRAEHNAALAEQRAEDLRASLYYNSINLAEKAYETGNSIEMTAALEQCPPDLRGWEYWHLKRLTDESALTWKAHEIADGPSVMFSPDGRFLLTNGLESARFPPVNRTTKIWDAQSGALLHVLDENNPAIQGCASFSPDGKRVAVGGRTFRFRVYDAETWQMLYEVDRGSRGHERSTTSIAFSGDSAKIIIADGYRDSAFVHDAANGALLRELSQPLPSILDTSRDGRLVAFGSIRGTATVWDLETGEQLVALPSHGQQVRGIAFAPDGSHIMTAAWDGRVRAWELPSGALRFISEARPDAATRMWEMQYSPDGRYFALCSSFWIELWDAHRALRQRTLLGHTAATLGVAFSPDSDRVAGTAADGSVRIWDLRGGRGRREIGRCPGVVAWSGDGRWIASFGEDNRLVLYDAVTELPVWEKQAGVPQHWASDVAFSPDGKLIACSGVYSDIEFRDVATGKLVNSIVAHMGRAGRLAWSSDGRLLASLGTDQFMRIWEAKSGSLVREILVGTSEVVMGTAFAVAFSPDGGHVAASARDSAIRIWSVSDGQLRSTMSGHELDGSVGGLVYTSSGEHIVSCSLDGTVRVWNVARSECERTLRGPRGGLLHLALAPDDQHVFAAGDDLRLWDITTGRQVLKITDRAIGSVALSPDGRRLVGTARDGALLIWDGSPLE